MAMERYEETYKGVKFFINDKCAGLTDGAILLGWHFDRYLTNEEIKETEFNKRKQAIRNGIDRLLLKCPVYTGDIRDRWHRI